MERVKTYSKIDMYLSKTYKVIFHNDDKTTFEFVALCLMNIFDKSIIEATDLTLAVDKNGFCIAGTGYTKDIAETKKSQVIELAKINGFPFQVSIEEE